MAESELYFYKGDEEVLQKIKEKADEKTETALLKKIQDSFNKVLDGKHLSFLLGSGCSSYYIEKEEKKWEEVGIPTMAPLATNFYENILSDDDKNWLKKDIKLDITSAKFQDNLEIFLGTLHSLIYFYETTNQSETDEFIKVKGIIEKARNFLLEQCLNETKRGNEADIDLINLYKMFYRKLLYRNTNLPKPSIFTTNYDLYSEIALDSLGIHYVNGFSGGIKKYFNPTIFNYALAEKMDLSQGKWSVIDNFIYLYKIHGSINWVQDEEQTKLFRVREIQETTLENLKKKDVIMIHPTPLKQNASMGSPYSDLFREFQKRLMRNNNILITLGYSFSDEHINNLIYQAFTIPSFRLIVFGDFEKSNEIKKLKSLNDPRIWIVGGKLENEESLHYFKGFVEQILPDLSNDEIDDKIDNAIKTLFPR
ncbi:SIR2 family protein [Gelidibacter pelagius]|uniref:SIR2 family protein n=1 Tax=Gelidibacter pelagius TaxID=2819985 RepID=A0ABS3SX31_9FLAO|nr:SIR2 family protein [Gelidibacter pelagius]MBO3100278.1 SIR2 family protein [Gelidibacter pelagius]